MPAFTHAWLFVILQKYDFSSKSQLREISPVMQVAVCDTAKVRFFKQITTEFFFVPYSQLLFVILQKYDFSSKSQPYSTRTKSRWAVCDTAKVRFFKQITTVSFLFPLVNQLFVILQKYDFSSKSQRITRAAILGIRCLWYCKSTIFQANHNLMVIK